MKTVVLRDGLELLSPGAVYVPHARTLVVADLHVGYCATLRARGHAVPEGNDDELITRLERLLDARVVQQLVVAGDLIHGHGSTRATPERNSALERFVSWVNDRNCSLRVVLGNHDQHAREIFMSLHVDICTEAFVAGHLVQHGDDTERVHLSRTAVRETSHRVILGHVHPAFTLDGGTGSRAKRPAFVTGQDIVFLPALSPFARGGDVFHDPVLTTVRTLAGAGTLGVAVCVAHEVIPVGQLPSID